MAYLLVFLGSGIGGLLRFCLHRLQESTDVSFPIATLLCNFLGSISIIFAFYYVPNGNFKVFLCAGILGGFTTYSTFVLNLATTQMPWWYLGGNIGIIAFCMVFFKMLNS